MPSLLSVEAKKRFCPSNVQSGFDASGVIRFATLRQHQDDPVNNSYTDPKHILAIFQAFKKPNQADAQLVLDNLPALTEKMMTQGIIYEEDFEDAFADTPGLDNHQAPAANAIHLNIKTMQN